jgi:hypothetical protein
MDADIKPFGCVGAGDLIGKRLKRRETLDFCGPVEFVVPVGTVCFTCCNFCVIDSLSKRTIESAE